MSNHFDRLRRAERWWAAEIIMRLIGILVLGGGCKLALFAHQMTSTRPPHQATLGEFAICAVLVLALTSGLALTLFGPEVFNEVPTPRSSRLY